MNPYVEYEKTRATVLHAGHFIKASSVDDMEVQVLQYVRGTITVSAVAKGGVEITYSMTHDEAMAFHEALGAAISAAEGQEVVTQEKAYDDLYRGSSDDD